MLPEQLSINGKAVLKERRDHWEDLLRDFECSGLATPGLRTEIETGLSTEFQKFWANLWEAMLYRHFKRRGFRFRCDYQRAGGQNGPDIGLIDGDRTIWIEATVPKPEGIPSTWLELSPDAHSFGPETFDAIRLRWTSALSDKLKQFRTRIENGIIGAKDAYVIAVNSCMLVTMEGGDFGLSQLPFAAEAVLPIGPLVEHVPYPNSCGDNKARKSDEISPSWQCPIRKHNGSPVRTDNFLDGEYSCISALIGCSRVSMSDGDAGLIVVHNPLAKNRIDVGRLNARVEYTVTNITDVSFTPRTHPRSP